MSDWPRRPDGSNKTIGEMSPDEQDRVTRDAGKQLEREFAQPAVKAGIAEVLNAEPAIEDRSSGDAAPCFACGKLIRGTPHKARSRDDDQNVFVGPDCYAHITKAGNTGYQPPKGGPVLVAGWFPSMANPDGFEVERRAALDWYDQDRTNQAMLAFGEHREFSPQKLLREVTVALRECHDQEDRAKLRRIGRMAQREDDRIAAVQAFRRACRLCKEAGADRVLVAQLYQQYLGT